MGSLLISQLQHDMAAWRDKNFGETINTELGNAQSQEQLLGVVEEVGELSHIVLKASQGIRGGIDPITLAEEEADAIGDIFVFLAGYCSRRQIDMEYCILKTWDAVKQRDWIMYPKDGRTE